MELKNLRCPNCGAELQCQNDVDIYFCSHCGSKLIEDGVSDTVAAARVVSKSIDHTTYLAEKKLAYDKYKFDAAEKRKDKEDREFKKSWMFESIIMGILILVVVLGQMDSIKRELGFHGKDDIKMPASSETLEDEGLEAVMLELENAGFTNITCVPIKDLVVGLFTKDGDIESVSVEGVDSFESGVYFPKDAAITIRYHTYKPKDD